MLGANKKTPQKRGLVMLVGRARFELATNGLKVRIYGVFNDIH